jgi:hypothetical protein
MRNCDTVSAGAFSPTRIFRCHRKKCANIHISKLSHHIVEEVFAGLAPRKTGPELAMERPEFVKESVDIMGSEIKRRNGEHLALRSTCR